MNSLTTFFDWLLTASLRASLLTLAVGMVQFLLCKHLSPRWRYALWLPVLVVLLMPVLPESRWSLESVMKEKPQIVEITPAPLTTPLPPADLPPAVADFTPASVPIDWQQISLLTWASGAALALLAGGLSFTRTLQRFQRTRQNASTETLAQLKDVAREVGLRRPPRLLVASTINSPAVTGLLRPVLLLPAGFEHDFTQDEARLILQHELTHLKRHDLPLNTLLCVLMALHWFNPLLWLAFFMARADREAACDAQVLENATPQRRSEYGHALLKIESAFTPFRLSLGFVGMLQRHVSLRARIRSIAAPTRTRPLGGMLATAGILGMTFLGITRAEKPAATEPPHEETKLIAIEVTTVHFKQDTSWDFDGRFKQLDPEDQGASSGGQIALLSPEDVRVLMEKLQKEAGAEVAAYPRMVTQDGKEVMIRSVVNQPVLGGKDTNGKSLIAYVPIGFVAKFIPRALPDDRVAMDMDLSDSRIVAKETVQGSDYPVASSRVFRGPVELNPGITAAHYAWQGHGWKGNKPVSHRPTITFVTTHVLDPKAGGLPADASGFTTGKSSFRPGDSIRITQVQRSGGFMTVTADYELASADAANISLHITSTKNNGARKVDPNQRKAVTKGKGRVVLHHPDVWEGMPHVSFYPTRGGSSFGGVYFGTQAEADASRKMSASRATRAASSTSGSTKSPDTGNAITLNFPDDPIETVIAIYAKLKGQKVSVEPAAKGNHVKIVAPDPLSPKDATAFIEAAFLLNGFLIVADGPDNLTIRKTDTPRPSVIETKLRNIILPRVQFSGASIEEAIDYLRVKSREFDTPDKTGVQFILRPGGTEPGHVTLDLKDVPLIEALRYCTELAGLTFKVEAYAVTIAATTAWAPAKLDITSNESSYDKKTGVLTAKGDAKTQCGKMAIQANELVYDPKNQQLQMIAPFVITVEGTKQITSTDAKAVAALDLKNGRLSIQGGHKTQTPNAKSTARTRATKMVLPSVEFRDATLVEAIEFIRIKSRDVDPDKKGINILLKGDGSTVKITLSLKDVPVSEALHYIAELASHKLSADENAFVLSPKASDEQAAAAGSIEPKAGEALTKAAELRRAKPQQYDFAKANLGDVLRYLATDARISFISLPDDHPACQKLVTFSVNASPFAVLEQVAKANGLILVPDNDTWYIRLIDDPELIGRSYPLLDGAVTFAEVSDALQKLIKAPATVRFDEKKGAAYINATRLQHAWVEGFFKGLHGTR